MSLENNLSKLPETCYSVSEYPGELIQLRRGMSGYLETNLSTPDKEKNRALADKLNAELGVTKEQEQAMSVGSMFGFHVPGADPDLYNQPTEENQLPAGWDQERGYSLNNGEYYFHIQTCDDGYDYTIYCKDFSDWDGGQYDDPDISMDEAVDIILEEFELQDMQRNIYDPDEIRMKSEIVEMERINAVRAEMGIEPLGDRIAGAQERSEQQAAERDARNAQSLVRDNEKERDRH